MWGKKTLTVVLKVLGGMVQNLVILVLWHLGFVHPPEWRENSVCVCDWKYISDANRKMKSVGIAYIKRKDGVNVCGFRSIIGIIQVWNCYYEYVCEIRVTNTCEAAGVGMSVYETNIWPWPSLNLYLCYENLSHSSFHANEVRALVCQCAWLVNCIDFFVIAVESVWLYLLWLLVAVTTLFGSGILYKLWEMMRNVYVMLPTLHSTFLLWKYIYFHNNSI